jgi:hypothetical protein
MGEGRRTTWRARGARAYNGGLSACRAPAGSRADPGGLGSAAEIKKKIQPIVAKFARFLVFASAHCFIF